MNKKKKNDISEHYHSNFPTYTLQTLYESIPLNLFSSRSFSLLSSLSRCKHVTLPTAIAVHYPRKHQMFLVLFYVLVRFAQNQDAIPPPKST